MQKRALRVLEYFKIINMLEEKAQSHIGKELARDLKPYTDFETAEKKQLETQEAVDLTLKRGTPPLGGLSDIEADVLRAIRGGMLTPASLLKVSDALRVARRLQKYLANDRSEKKESYPIIEDYIGRLLINRDLEETINHAIVSEEEVSDDASSELKRIRKQIRIKNDAAKSKLNSMLVSHRKYLQDAIITVRGDRYVIPVRAEYKVQVKGIVHDQSASGATLFIEPIAIVELNNKVKELQIKEKKEIERILLELSALVGEEGEALRYNQKLLAEIDFIFAKGSLSLKMEATMPKLNNNGIIKIKKGRHPLIPKNEVVANDIRLGEEFTSVVITGPNTGGKTVTLKTLGLLTLMAQSGLQIPALSGSKINVFSQVFADIGDEQSIEQSLSTFSSHMTNIVEILENVDENSLVLFDELGAGTDPVEGAALAMAILTKLYKRRVRTLATTHYSELKIFALTTKGVENASVEFDVNSLKPTYKLLIGVPGRSNAFEISKRLGLNDEIIDESRRLISSDNVEFETVLNQIEEDRLATEKNREETDRLKNEIESLKEKLTKKETSLAQQKTKILNDARRDAKAVLKDAKKDADELLKEMREILKHVPEEAKYQREMQIKRDELNKKLGDVSGMEAMPKQTNRKPPKNLKPGDTVILINHNQEASVLSKPDKDGQVLVQAGIMKMRVSINELKIGKSKEEKTIRTKNKTMSRIKSKHVSMELDIRGMNVEEAYLEVDKYLDDASLTGLKEVSIIHGKGTGVLREGVQDLLKRHRHVKAYRNGNFNEGGMGVTVATIK
ncbi:MAG: endonuclease MutS2 [Tissierellales bacterium]|jgi:DNA mismatch repair protein MutS2|nr:endonuclease MutS2 [Tissierellales bacterium]